MRTRHGAAVALYTALAVPLGYHGCYAALGIGRRAVFPCTVQHTVLLEYGNRQLVALLAVHRENNVLDKRRCVYFCRRHIRRVRPAFRDIHLDRSVYAPVNGFVVHIDDFLARLFEV